MDVVVLIPLDVILPPTVASCRADQEVNAIPPDFKHDVCFIKLTI